MRKDFKTGGSARQFKQVLERLGGDEKAKPHSTKKGRIEAGVRKLVRMVNPKSGQKTAPPPKKLKK